MEIENKTYNQGDLANEDMLENKKEEAKKVYDQAAQPDTEDFDFSEFDVDYDQRQATFNNNAAAIKKAAEAQAQKEREQYEQQKKQYEEQQRQQYEQQVRQATEQGIRNMGTYEKKVIGMPAGAEQRHVNAKLDENALLEGIKEGSDYNKQLEAAWEQGQSQQQEQGEFLRLDQNTIRNRKTGNIYHYNGSDLVYVQEPDGSRSWYEDGVMTRSEQALRYPGRMEDYRKGSWRVYNQDVPFGWHDDLGRYRMKGEWTKRGEYRKFPDYSKMSLSQLESENAKLNSLFKSASTEEERDSYAYWQNQLVREAIAKKAGYSSYSEAMKKKGAFDSRIRRNGIAKNYPSKYTSALLDGSLVSDPSLRAKVMDPLGEYITGDKMLTAQSRYDTDKANGNIQGDYNYINFIFDDPQVRNEFVTLCDAKAEIVNKPVDEVITEEIDKYVEHVFGVRKDFHQMHVDEWKKELGLEGAGNAMAMNALANNFVSKIVRSIFLDSETNNYINEAIDSSIRTHAKDIGGVLGGFYQAGAEVAPMAADAVTIMPLLGGATSSLVRAIGGDAFMASLEGRMVTSMLTFAALNEANYAAQTAVTGTPWRWSEAVTTGVQGASTGLFMPFVGAAGSRMVPYTTSKALPKVLGKTFETAYFAGDELLGKFSRGEDISMKDVGIAFLNSGIMVAGFTGIDAMTSTLHVRPKQVESNTLKELEANGYGELVKDLKQFNAQLASGTSPDALHPEAMKDIARLLNNQDAGRGDMSWEAVADASRAAGLALSTPMETYCDIEERGGKYYAVTYDSRGRAVKRSKRFNTKDEATQERDKVSATIESNKEAASEQAFIGSRDFRIKHKAARSMADEANAVDGKSALNADGTVNEEFRGITAPEIMAIYHSLAEKPVKERSAAEQQFVEDFESRMANASAGMPDVDFFKKKICEEFGITEEAFDAAWKLAPKDRGTGKEADACRAYNKVLSNGYNIASGETVGTAYIDGRECRILNRIEVDGTDAANPEDVIFYLDENNKVQKTTAEGVVDIKLTEDPDRGDYISLRNKEKDFEQADKDFADGFKNIMSEESDAEIRKSIEVMEEQIKNGEDPDGRLRRMVAMQRQELYDREGLRSPRERATRHVEEFYGDKNPEEKAELTQYYTEHPIQLEKERSEKSAKEDTNADVVLEGEGSTEDIDENDIAQIEEGLDEDIVAEGEGALPAEGAPAATGPTGDGTPPAQDASKVRYSVDESKLAGDVFTPEEAQAAADYLNGDIDAREYFKRIGWSDEQIAEYPENELTMNADFGAENAKDYLKAEEVKADEPAEPAGEPKKTEPEPKKEVEGFNKDLISFLEKYGYIPIYREGSQVNFIGSRNPVEMKALAKNMVNMFKNAVDKVDLHDKMRARGWTPTVDNLTEIYRFFEAYKRGEISDREVEALFDSSVTKEVLKEAKGEPKPEGQDDLPTAPTEEMVKVAKELYPNATEEEQTRYATEYANDKASFEQAQRDVENQRKREAQDKKIDELLDAMGTTDEADRAADRKFYRENPEALEADYNEFVNKSEPPKNEPPKSEPPKQEPKKVEPKSEPPKREEPKVVDDLNAPMPTKEVNGKQVVDYDRATPRRTHKYIYEERGYDKERADKIVENSIKAAEDAIKAHQKKKPKEPTADPAALDEYDAKVAEWEAENARLKAEKEYWEGVQAVEMDKDILQKLESPPYGKDGNNFMLKLLRRFRGDREIESILTNRWEPRTIEEAVIVALASSKLKLIWNDEKLKGVKQELNWGEGERKKFVSLFGKKENGAITISKLSERIANEFADGEFRDRQPEVRDMIINALQSASSRAAFTQIINGWKFREVADILKKRERGSGGIEEYEADRRAEEEYNAFVEEHRDELPENFTQEDVFKLMDELEKSERENQGRGKLVGWEDPVNNRLPMTPEEVAIKDGESISDYVKRHGSERDYLLQKYKDQWNDIAAVFSEGLNRDNAFDVGKRVLEIVGNEKDAAAFLSALDYIDPLAISHYLDGAMGPKERPKASENSIPDETGVSDDFFESSGEDEYVPFRDGEGDSRGAEKFRDGETPTFYSNAARAVENIKQNKATAEQWLAMIKKNGGLKAGEDKWMGLTQWLDENKGKSLTKEEVQQFIADNGIEMEEQHYGTEDYRENPQFKKLQEEFSSIVQQKIERWETARNYLDNVFSANMEKKYGTKFWGELLNQDERARYIELEEEARGDFDNAAMEEMVRRYGEDFNKAFYSNYGNLDFNQSYTGVPNKEAQSFLGISITPSNPTRLEYTTNGLDNKREIAFKVPSVEPYQEHDAIHFGPENQGKAVMWVRFGETYDADGNRVLVIDEIQSNRHQKGRENGYYSPKTRDKATVEKELRGVWAEINKFESNNFSTIARLNSKRRDAELQQLPTEKREEYEIIQQKLKNLQEEWNTAPSRNSAVPEAPFEKNWHEVAMKRMLRLAAEEGFDKVAWTTGEQQAERYDLSSEISGIEVRRDGVNAFTGKPEYDKYNVWTYDRNGNVVITASGQMEPEKIIEVFGKDLGNRILATEEGKKQTIDGEGLSIGGEGMKGFYDNILPRFMDKYGRRWGVKTGTVELPNVEEAGRTMHSVDVTPEMKESVMQGQPLFRTSKELNEQYPTWLSGQTTDSGQHTTQITSTVKSYNRIGDWMKKNGMEGASVLDASSGLGVGTRSLRGQGFNVDDVEPYPSKDREAPTYQKYEDIDKKYDVVISNAVLNVIPDDWRADVLKSMADKLKVGGKLIINVRDAKSIEGQKQKIELDSPSEILVTDSKGNIRAYQKGFTKKELQEWVKSELGEGWEVEVANENNSGLKSGVAVVVTRGEGAAPVRYRSFEPIGERGVKKVTQVKAPETRDIKGYDGKTRTYESKPGEYKVEGMDDTFRSVEEAADAVRRRNPDYCVYIDNEGNIRLEAWSNLLPEGMKPNTYAKVIAMSGGEMSSAMKKRIGKYTEREMEQARKEAETLTQELGLDVEFHDDPSEFSGRKAKAKGWYDPKTGKIHVVMGNHSGVGDVMATMLHEGVAHHGLRKMFGNDFDTFLDNVHKNVDSDIRAEIDSRIDKMRAADEEKGEKHSDDYYRRAATEEYIAELSEDGLYNAEKHGNIVTKAWQYIKENFIKMLRKAGYKGEISDDELRYILWKSHENLRQSAVEMAKDAVLKDKAGIKDYVEEGEPVKKAAERGEQMSLFPGKEPAASLGRAREMSDADLLEEIGKDRYEVRSTYTDEYDRRHKREHRETYDSTTKMLEEGNTTLEQAGDMLIDAAYDLRDKYTSKERAAAKARFEAIQDYYFYKEAELDKARDDFFTEHEQELKERFGDYYDEEENIDKLMSEYGMAVGEPRIPYRAAAEARKILTEDVRFRDGEETPVRDFNAERRELMRRRLRGEDVTAELEQLRADRRAAEEATRAQGEGAEPRAASGGEGNGEPPEPPRNEPPATEPEAEPEPQRQQLPPTAFDRPMTPIEMAQEAAIKVVNDTKASLEQRNAARRELGRSLYDLHNQIKDLAGYGDKVEAVKAELQELKSQYGTMPRDEYRQRKAEIEKKLNRLFKGKRFWKGLEEVGDEIEDNGNFWISNTLRQVETAQRAYDRATVENVVSLCKMMVQSGLIDHSYISNLTPLFTKLKDATGKQDLTSTVNDIMDVMLKSQERSIRNELNTLLNTKAQRINQSGVVTQGGVDLRGQRTLQSLNENFGKSVEDIDKRIRQLEDMRGRIPENSKERLNDVDDKIQGALLAKQYIETAKNHEDNITAALEELAEIKAQYKDGELGLKEYTEQKHALEAQIRSYRMSHADAMWDYVNTMRGIVAEGKSRAKDFIEAQKAHKNEIRHNAYSDMAGTPQYTQSRPGGLAKAVNSSASQFVSSSLYTLDTMLRQLGHKHANGEGYLYERFGRGWLDARDREIRDYWADREELDKKSQELFGVKHFANLIDAIRKMPKMDVPYKDGGEIVNHTLDQAQLMYIYMVNKMEDGVVKLRRMGISEENVEAIKNFMNPKLVELADWLQKDFLPSRREGYNEVHRRMFGADMDMVENYVPLRIDKGALTETVDINNGQNEPSLASTVTGGIIKRTHNASPIDIMGTNAIDMILEHLDEMNHWKNFAEWNRDVNTLLSDKTFRNKVKNTTTIYGSGDKLWKHLKDVFFIAGGTYKPKGEGIDKAVVNIAKGVSAAKVSFRIFTATKQLLSLPVFAANCNVGYMVKNMARPAGSWNWCMENLPSFRQRWQSRIAGDTRLEDTDIDWQYTHKKWVEKASKWGLSPNAFVDAMTVAVGARSVYEQRYKRYRKDGYDDAAADRRARQDATAAFNQTQQSSEKMFVAPMQVDRTVLAVGASLFRNASMGYERQFVEGLRNLKHLMGKERVVDEDGNVSTVSYRKASIEFMKKQMERNGLTETQAEAAAKRIYNRSMWRNALKIAMFGFGAQLAWNIGGKLPYLAAQGYNAIFGSDEERKKAGANAWDTAKEAMWHAAAGGWLEGLPFGNVVSDGINNEINGENFFKFSPDLLPFFGDTEDVANHFDGKNKFLGVTDLVNLGAQIFIGVNPQTFLDIMAGIVDITAGKDQSKADFGTAKEALLLTMRIMQCPQSQLDQLYIDELGMSARQAQSLTPEQVARRYAFYKAHHDVPYLWHLYNQEKQDELIKQYENNFNKKLNKDVKDAGGTPEDYHDLMESSTTNKEHDKYKGKEIDALSAQGPEALMKAWEKERDKGSAADYKYMKSLMTRYQKDVYGKGKTPTEQDEADLYKETHGEDIKEQAQKIGRDLGFSAQDSYFQLSQYKAQHTSAKDPVMKEFNGNDGGFKYSKKGKFFKMEDYTYKVPVKDKAKRAKALKVMKDHKEELRRNYRNGWRMARIKALYENIEEEAAKKDTDKGKMKNGFIEILNILEDERKDAAEWEKKHPTKK